jgi:hypothetical protein
MSRAQLQRAPARTPAVEVTAVGWQADADLPYEDWLRYGSRLGLAGRNAAWWVGDWVRYGTARYGSKYTAASKVTGYDRQTLMNYVYVASRFDVSRRRENLSWSHHAELAALEPQKQEEWLDRATIERLTVRDLREALVSAGPRRRAAATKASHSGVSTLPAATRQRGATSPRVTQTVTCPHCGEAFAL